MWKATEARRIQEVRLMFVEYTEKKKRLHIYKFIVCWILNLIQIDKCQEGRSWDWCAISNFTVISMLLLSCGSQQTTASMQNLYENIRNLDLVECWVICFNILTAKLANQVKQTKMLLRKQRKFIELIAFLIGEQTFVRGRNLACLLHFSCDT